MRIGFLLALGLIFRASARFFFFLVIFGVFWCFLGVFLGDFVVF